MASAADPSVLRDWLSGPAPLLELPGDTNPDGVLEALCDQGFDARRVDLAGVSDKAGLLDALHRALALGDWFGFNWDALEEALYGPEDRSAPERVVVMTGFEAFRTQAPKDAGVVLDILRSVAETPGSGLRGCVLIG
ncbi:barstar family protein [Thioalkalivibrio sp.]|uniref:barstar family protein n=1 Tax=Thioalkalivibrio sp. TaxID=2093813 RepID=UPI0012D52439|nr:barstar family protein [Thioalkalivibrio sp.]TVP82325.1 MAG: barnase inhibitor [Thioalkalivibrio sp.]